MEKKYFVDEYGREYISWENVQKELGITQMDLMELLARYTGYNWMMNHKFNGESYFERQYFETDILTAFNHLKESNRLHEIQWKLPDKR